ncbi:MAG: hypothetical protein J0I92_07585 [Phyllobacterium sp.]|nr:hypothetical protein [Phyllobacterium sp.]
MSFDTPRATLDAYAAGCKALDRDLLKWVTGEAEVPEEFDTPIFHRILASRNAMKF